MTQIKLTSVTRYDKDKDGNPLKTKDGRPYTRLVIGAEGYEKKLSGFDGLQTKDWAAGSEVDVEIEQKGEYLNFKVPNKQDLVGKAIEELNGRTMKILLMVEEIGRAVVPKPKDDYPTPQSQGLDPDNMGNFDNPREDDPSKDWAF